MQWSDSDEVYSFDDFRVDVKERRVWRGTSLVPMSPKTFDLLVVMVQGAGRLLQKDYLIRSVWPDSYVQEANLSVHISNLRKALGQNSESQQFIETVPKIGYRLVVPVLRTRSFLEDGGAKARDDQEEAIALPQIEVEQPSLGEQKTAAPISVSVKGREPASSRHGRWWLAASFLALCMAAISILFWRTSRTRHDSAVATSTRPLTGPPGQFLQPSFSPDGEELAYTWRSSSDSHQSIYLQSIASDDRKLLIDTGGDDFSPVWSPDGTEIAFLHTLGDDQPLEVVVTKKDSPAERRNIATICAANDIFRTSPTLSWSPDGRNLVTTDCPGKSESPGLTMIAVKTGEKLALTRPPTRTWDDQAAYSPDGSQIAFRRSRGDASDEIYIIQSDGGQERELTFRSNPVDGLAWSRDGKRIVFASGQATSLGNIWSLNLAGGEPVAVTTPLTHTSSPAISPAGERMVYVDSPRNASVWRLSMGSHRSAEPFILSNFFDASAVYSPDGNYVAFRSDRSGANEIWICHSDGTGPKRITHFNGPMTGSPSWSPDSRSLAFDSREGGRSDIYVANLATGASVRITNSAQTNSDNVVPSWSHDGKTIYFSTNRTGSWQIWQHTMNSGTDTQVTTNGGFYAMETADGNSLIYVGDLGRTEIRQLFLQGQRRDIPLTTLGSGMWHSWTISQEGLFFLKSSSSGQTEISRFDLRSSKLQALGEVAQVVNDNLSVSPDGRWILFARRSNTYSSIMILDGWK